MTQTKFAVSIKALYISQASFKASFASLHLYLFAALWRLLALKLDEGNIRFRIACFRSETPRWLLAQSPLGIRELSEIVCKEQVTYQPGLLSVASCSVPLFRTLSPWTASSSSAECKLQAPRGDYSRLVTTAASSLSPMQSLLELPA